MLAYEKMLFAIGKSHGFLYFWGLFLLRTEIQKPLENAGDFLLEASHLNLPVKPAHRALQKVRGYVAGFTLEAG